MAGKSAYMDWSVENRCLHCDRVMRPANRKDNSVEQAVHASRGYCHKCYSKIRRGTLEDQHIDWSNDVNCLGCERPLRSTNKKKLLGDITITHFRKGMCKRCWVNTEGDPEKLRKMSVYSLCVECESPLRAGTARLSLCSDQCQQKRYRRENKSTIQKIKTRRRYNEVTQFLILDRDLDRLLLLKDQRCSYCKTLFTKHNKVNWDHIVPLSRGGKHSIGNLTPSCRKCNTSKGSRYLVEWKKNPLRQ